MSAQNGTKPKIIALRHNPDDQGHFRQRILNVEYNEDGIPIVLHIRCKERECCPKIDGIINIHLFTIWGTRWYDVDGETVEVGVGQYVTAQQPAQTLEQMPLGARVVGGAIRR